MRSLLTASLIFVLVLCSLCVEEQKNITSIEIDNQIYQFNTNLYESDKIKCNDEYGVKSLFDSSHKFCIAFDNSSQTDNSYCTVVSYNLVFKITRYYTLSNRTVNFSVCSPEEQRDLTIWLKGPNTGADETSVMLTDSTITVQGTDFNNLEMAGDNLILIIFGVKL